MRYRIILVLLLLTLLPVSLAAWKTTTLEYMSKGNNAYINNVNIRVQSIDVANERVNVTISNDSTLFDGWITTNHTIPERLRVTPLSYRNHKGTPQVRLAVSDWVNADLGSLNVPPKLYNLGAYKTYVEVENTGPSKATFILRAEGTNLHLEKSSKEGSVHRKNSLKNVQSTIAQNVTIPPNTVKKIYFTMQPVKDSGKATLNYTLLQEQQVIDAKHVTISIVDDSVGYIEDITVPDDLRAGVPTTATVTVRHTWSTTSQDYYVKLESPSFRIQDQTQPIQVYPQEAKQIKYTITPYGGGEFILRAILSQSQTTIDRLHKTVEVFGQDIYTITNVQTPAWMRKGTTYDINITINNRGEETNDIGIQFRSHDFKIRSPKRIVRLRPGHQATVTLQIEPITTDSGTFTLQLTDEPEGMNDRKLLERKVMQERTITTNLWTPTTDDKTTPVKEKEQSKENTSQQPPADTTVNQTTNDTTPPRSEGKTGNKTQANKTTVQPTQQQFVHRVQSLTTKYWYYGVIFILLCIILYQASSRNEEKAPEDMLEDEL